jgi:hypothetical protein
MAAEGAFALTAALVARARPGAFEVRYAGDLGRGRGDDGHPASPDEASTVTPILRRELEVEATRRACSSRTS